MVIDLPPFHAMKEAVAEDPINLDPPSAEHQQTMPHLHFQTGMDLLWHLGQQHQRLSRSEKGVASLRDQLAVQQWRLGVVAEWIAVHELTLAGAGFDLDDG